MLRKFTSGKFKSATAITMATTFLMIAFGAAGSGAAAQIHEIASAQSEPSNSPSVSANSPDQAGVAAQAETDVDTDNASPVNAASLAALVAQQPVADELPQELNCLAGAVYFEAGHETLSGQLAVARVVVARAKSGRFPDSYCGVVYQPSQFSFIHGASMPTINYNSRAWHNAVAIAEIAHAGTWDSPVEGALFFHSTRVSPRWHLQRVARVDNHIFYR